MSEMMSWAEAMRIASANLKGANQEAGSVGGEASASVHAYAAVAAIAYARELRAATEGKSKFDVERMMNG